MTATDTPRWTGTGTHRTRTIEWVTGERWKSKQNGSCGRWVNNTAAKAECVCGWSEYGNDRAGARWRARTHRATVIVPVEDLSEFVMLMCEQAMPFDALAAFRRLDDALRAADGDSAEVPLFDLRIILRQANRPYIFAEHPYIPRLITVAEKAHREPVGMVDSVRSYCELVASSHGLTWDEWIRHVTP